MLLPLPDGCVEVATQYGISEFKRSWRQAPETVCRVQSSFADTYFLSLEVATYSCFTTSACLLLLVLLLPALAAALRVVVLTKTR